MSPEDKSKSGSGFGGFSGLMQQAGGLGGLMKAMGGSPMGFMSAFYGMPFYDRSQGGMVNPFERVFMQQVRQGKMPQFQQPAQQPQAAAPDLPATSPAAPQAPWQRAAMARFGRVPGLLG